MIEQLGPYRIDKQIGRGGMGTVYSGVNDQTGEKAAIKILAAGFAEDPGFRGRFLAEIETLKQLRHPNIVRLLGDGEQDGQLFYVMELVEGRSLQEELQSGHQYDWQETTEIAIQICQALKHAHDHGVIHRDLKPANLLRTPDNQIKLTDFGIAKLFGGSQLTAAGSVVGTADFMSPEQAEGRGVTNRSDLYSLGTVMFTLLARRPPFGGASLPQVVHKLRYEEAPSVRRFAPQVPQELELIISQLLSKDADQRVATALVLANRLRAMKHGLASRDEPKDPPNAGRDANKRSPDPTPSDEQVTRISDPGRGPETELNPTAVDDFELRADIRAQSGGPSWNDVTMDNPESVSANRAAGDSAAGDSAAGDRPTGNRVSRGDPAGQPNSAAGAGASRQTVVDTPPPVNRFTTIEAEQRRKRQETIDTSARRREVVKVSLMAVALVACVGWIAWSLRPASADDLYARIVENQTEKDIDKFLEKFSEDPRADEVKGYQLEILSERYFSNLVRRARKNTLDPLEAVFVQAMKDRDNDPDAAREGFLEVLRAAPTETASEDLRRCAEYAAYQLQKLGEPADAPHSD